MNDQPLDEWRDRMVSALNGELSTEAQQELKRAIAMDEELQRDWLELNEARAILGTLRDDEDQDEQVL